MLEFKRDLKRELETIELNNASFADHNKQFEGVSQMVVEKHAPMVVFHKKEGEPDWLDLEYRRNGAKRRKLEKKI